MTLHVCDRCKKQISRFVHVDKYQIRMCVDEENWAGETTLSFCQSCQELLNYNLDHFLNDDQPETTKELVAAEDFKDTRTDTFEYKNSKPFDYNKFVSQSKRSIDDDVT